LNSITNRNIITRYIYTFYVQKYQITLSQEFKIGHSYYVIEKVRQYCLNILHLLKEFKNSSHGEIIRIFMMQYLFPVNLAQKSTIATKGMLEIKFGHKTELGLKN
jgi:hypothetical protein